MRVTTSLLCLAVAACGDDAPVPVVPPTGDAMVTVTHYDYRFDLETRRAHARLALTFVTAGDCVTLPFRATELDAATLLVDGEAPTASQATATSLKVCGAGRDAGATMTLDTDQTVPLATLADSQVGYSIRTDGSTAHNPFSYLVSWVGGCDRFGPCDSRPDQFATYAFHVTHPAALMVACSGTITEVSPTETTCAFDLPGGPTYSTFGFAAYPRTAWLPTDKGMWGTAKVTVYDRTDTGIAAGIDAAYHAGFVAMMEQKFGPYPFGADLRVLVAPTYWAGFEHPGNIVIDDSLKKVQIGSAYASPLAHTLDHEIAHQWAGDQTTIADTYDFVWKESMAEYLAFVYEDSVDPTVGLKTADAWKQFSVGAQYFPVPGEKPALFDYYGDVYGPGPMILFRQIEVLSSRANVIAALQSVLGTPRALSVDEVVAALETSTGLDLAAYAAAWIHGSGAPVFPQVDVAVAVDATSVHVVQSVAPERRCKFHLALRGAQPTDELLVAVDTFTGGIDQTLAITPAFAVTNVVVDPLRECLMTAHAITAAPANAPHRNPWLAPL